MLPCRGGDEFLKVPEPDSGNQPARQYKFARVQPGVVLDDLRNAANEHGVPNVNLSRDNGCDYCDSADSFLTDKKFDLAPEVTDTTRCSSSILPITNALRLR